MAARILKWLILAILVAFTGQIVFRLGQRGRNLPRLAMEVARIDLHEVPCRQVEQAVFVLRNDGRRPLHVSVRSISCNCTKVDTPNEPILPGKSAKIVATINAPASAGPFGSDVDLETNDPEHPTVKLSLVGVASPLILLDKAVIFMGSPKSVDLPQSSTIYVTRGKLATLRTLLDSTVSIDDDRIKLKVEPAGTGINVQVTLTSDISVGVLRKNLRIRCREPFIQEFTIPVVAEVVGECHAEPSGFLFGRVAGSDPVERQCEISHLSDDSDPHVEFDAEYKGRVKMFAKRMGGGKAVVTATITPSDDKEPINTQVYITLSTRGKQIEHLELPLIAMFR